MVVRSVSEVVHGIKFEIFGDDYVRIPNKNQVMLISKNLVEKSRIWETPTLSTHADSSTDYKVINIFHFLNPYFKVYIL